MAIMTCNYSSSVLKRYVTINVFIPTPDGNEQISREDVQKQYHYKDGLPVVYLLHGAYGNYSSWLRFSNVERYAQKHCCALVMASADNSFYQDKAHGDAYHTFFAEELPEFIKNVFPVSGKREDTYIAGFSMGGYGAWYLALSHPEKYCKAASMSGVLDIAPFGKESNEDTNSPFNLSDIFQNPDELKGSHADLFKLYDDCVASGTVPKLYQACGTEDFLYPLNQAVKDKLEKKGADLTYEEGKGEHNWDFWDQYIQHILDWMLGA